jgi:feruloyl esterase
MPLLHIRSATLGSILPALLIGCGPRTRSEQAQSRHGPIASCESLGSLRLPDVRITEAVSLAADAKDNPTHAAHCRVSGVIGREIKFQALLPLDWNRRFLQGGGGGFVGSVAVPTADVARGYATGGTDTGHESSPVDATWARDEVERQVNYGHLAVHRTAETIKAVIRAFYGSDPEKSYFSGCSNGGRQALMEAQRYPDDFDGIVAGAPAFNFTTIAASFLRNIKAAFPAGPERSVVRPEALRLLEAKVLAACDAKDGVTDGTMEDPRDCGFRLSTISTCTAGRPGPDCLTGAEKATLETIGQPFEAGGARYPGQPAGGEGLGGGWADWITGGGGMMKALGNAAPPSAQFAFGTEIFKNFVFGDSAWDSRTYSLANARRDTRLVASYLDADNPDLSRFAARGGKLLLWHGWSDAALNALATIDYLDRAHAATPNFDQQIRLFLLPGVLHCSGGTGPDQVDWTKVIDDWVGQNKAPDRVVAATLDSTGKPTRTRPLCAYPARAVYSGKGSTDDEASFACKASDAGG